MSCSLLDLSNGVDSKLPIFSRKQLTVCQLKVMEKILQMLLLVVEQPSTPSSLISPILTLSLDHVLPLLMTGNNLLDHSDVAYILYSLFDG